MFKKGLFVTVLFIISTGIQLLSQIYVTRFFGAKINLEIFLAAVALPTIFVTIIYGTVNDVFLPLYTEKKVRSQKESESYFSSMIAGITVLSLLIALVFITLCPLISQSLYGYRGHNFVLEVAKQMQIMSLSIPFSIVVTMCGTYFYVHKKLGRFPFAQAMGSIANLLLIVCLAPYLGIMSLVYAFILNILFQIIFVIPSVKHTSFRLPDMRSFTVFIFLWTPLIVGNFAIRSDVLIIRSFATTLPVGYLVYLNLISKIFSLGTSVMTIGLQIVVFPHIVEYLVSKNHRKAQTYINRSKLIALILSIVTLIIMILATPTAIKLLFVGGKFTNHDFTLAVRLLPYFYLPAIGWGITSIFFQPLLVLKKQWQLGILQVCSLIAAWITSSYITSRYGGLLGISSGLSVLLFVSVLGAEVLWQIYKRKLA